MREEQIKLNQNRDTGLAICLILAILMVFLPHPVIALCLLGSLVLTMVNPRWCFWMTPIWFGFSHILGTVVSKVIFSVLFWSLVVPMGQFRKLTGRDPMHLKWWSSKKTATTESAFVNRDHTYTLQDLQTPY